MKNTYLFIIVGFILVADNSFSHDPLVHKYITQQAWFLVKDQHNVQYSAMNSRIGDWWLAQYDGTGPWQIGKIVTGAKREDEEDVMYGYCYPCGLWSNATNTHFWDPEDFECDSDPDNTKIKIIGSGYCFENSLVKAKNYWRGKKFANDDWLVVNVPVLSGPGLATNWYKLYLRYDDLANVYKYNQIYVTHAYYLHGILATPPYNPPRPLMDFNLQGGTRGRIENIVWEIVGRIAHLLGDAGVPAHTHNDVHPLLVGQGDTYESWMYSAQNFLDVTWTDAKQQGIDYKQTPIVDVLNIVGFGPANDPLRFLFYTTDQLADRLPSDDYAGDNSYDQSGPGYDPYYMFMTPIMNSMTTSMDKPSTVDTYEEAEEVLFPYSIRTTAGFLWYVYNKFGIVNTPPPAIYSLTQSPSVLCPNSSVYITCNLSQGGGVSYTWTPIELPPNITYEPIGNGSIVRITKSGSLTASMPVTQPFQMICTAYNGYGNDKDTIQVIHASTCAGGGCPWIYVYNSDSSAYVPDNNILHRSEFNDFLGSNINDLYKLQVQPTFDDNKCTIVIKETESDTNYYNNVKLYAVDHPVGTKIGVTESNDIVMYESGSLGSPDGASLNGSENITPYVQYTYEGNKIVHGLSGDSIYASFDSSAQMKAYSYLKNKYSRLFSSGSQDSLAIIAEVGYNDLVGIIPVNKDYAGDVTAYANANSYQRLFARRESNSTIIIPFAASTQIVDDVDVNWYRDYQVNYLSTVTVMYSGFTVTEMPIFGASHSNLGDCIVDISIDDTNFVKLDSASSINLQFEDIGLPAEGMVRDYVFYVNGRYTSSLLARPHDNVITDSKYELTNEPTRYKLHINYPNPFNPKTIIKYDVAKNGLVKIVVYDLLGRVVKELVNNFKVAGSYNVEFDGTGIASGVYIYKMESGNFAETRKMVLLK